jgi:iron(III) transport system substrate-binding protein
MGRLTRKSFLKLSSGLVLAAGAFPRAGLAQMVTPEESQAIWDELAAAARTEGKVVIMTNTQGVREEMAPRFQERFGVEAEVLISRGSAAVARVMQEFSVGSVTADLLISGLTSTGTIMYPAGAIAPIKPMLVHPEVLDPAAWLYGAPLFMDPDGDKILRTTEAVSNLITINTDVVDPAELRVSDDLLNPKWKGMISTHTVLASGAGSTAWAFMMLLKGDDFVRQLWAQEPFQTDEDRPIEDNLIRGVNPIALTVNPDSVRLLLEQGFPLHVTYWEDLPYQKSSSGTHLTAIQGHPHPNATKLFANWFASWEGQQMFAKASATPSIRLDVDNSHAAPWVVLQPGMNTYDVNSWEFSVVNSDVYAEQLNQILSS